MHRLILTFGALFIFGLSSFAQRAVVSYGDEEFSQHNFSATGKAIRSYTIKEVPLIKADPFMAISLTWEGREALPQDCQFWIIMGDQNGQWEEHFTIQEDEHGDKEDSYRVSNLIFASSGAKQFRLYLSCPPSGPVDISDLKVHFFNPGKTEELPEAGIMVENRDACVCPQPEYLDRLGWCPAGNCPEDATPVYTEVTHMVIHHTATSNSSSDWAAVVRSVWDYHVNTNGWDDIGYNWIIDPNGVLYEGRGDNRMGAHFCSTNSKTAGIALLGNFVVGNATEDAKSTLKDLLAWKSCDINVDPLGTAFHNSSGLNLNHILGHQDGCSTACPGDNFYPLIQGIREDVLDIMENDCEAKLNAPELTGQVVSNNLIKLSWADISDQEDAYVVERAIGNGAFETIITLPANAIGFDDATVEPFMEYHYRIQATSEDILDSNYSNEVELNTNLSNTNNPFLNRQTVQLFPNPVKDHFYLTIENDLFAPINLEILDASGKLIRSNIRINKNQQSATSMIEVNNLASGNYMLSLTQDGYRLILPFHVAK